MCLLRLYDSEPFLGEHFNPAQTDKQKRNVKRTHNIMEEQKIKRFLPTISLFSQLINIYIYFSLSHVGCAFVRFFFHSLLVHFERATNKSTRKKYIGTLQIYQ